MLLIEPLALAHEIDHAAFNDLDAGLAEWLSSIEVPGYDNLEEARDILTAEDVIATELGEPH